MLNNYVPEAFMVKVYPLSLMNYFRITTSARLSGIENEGYE